MLEIPNKYGDIVRKAFEYKISDFKDFVNIAKMNIRSCERTKNLVALKYNQKLLLEHEKNLKELQEFVLKLLFKLKAIEMLEEK